MRDVLDGLNAIPGVMGSALFDGNDRLVDNAMPHPYLDGLVASVMAELRNSLLILNYLEFGDGWTGFVIRFDAGFLVVRNVNGHTILVLAQPTLNLSMLSVGFNVAAQKIIKVAPAPAPLPLPLPPPPVAAGPQTSTAVSISGRFPAVSESARLSGSHLAMTPPPGMAPMSESGPSLASASMPASQSADMSTSQVNDAVGAAIIDQLLKALAKHIGPFAKLIMKEELNKIGATPQTLGFGQYEDFIAMLARRVQDPTKRREFMSEAERLPGKR